MHIPSRLNREALLLGPVTLGVLLLMLMATPAGAQSALTCSPAQQTASVGQQVTFTADGGSGSYIWATPSGVSTNSGSSFSTSFNEAGPNTVIVRRGSEEALCIVNVVGTSVGVTPPPAVGGIGGFPGLPSTGDGGGMRGVTMGAAVMLGALALLGGLYALHRRRA